MPGTGNHPALSGVATGKGCEDENPTFPLVLQREGGERRLHCLRAGDYPGLDSGDGVGVAAKESPGCFQLQKSPRAGDALPPAPRPLPGTHGLGAHQPPERREQEGAVQGRGGARGGAPGSGGAGQPRHAAHRPRDGPSAGGARVARGGRADPAAAPAPPPPEPPPGAALRSRCAAVSPYRSTADKGRPPPSQPPLPVSGRCSAGAPRGTGTFRAAVSCSVLTGDIRWPPAHPGARRCSSAGAG